MDTVFIYALNCPESGETRYVGKAENPQTRFLDHLRDKTRTHRANWIRSLGMRGLKPVLEILDEVPEEFWPQWEVAWIAFYREAGFDLVNATFGGEGNSGRIASPETRKKISIAHTGKKQKPPTAEARANISAAARLKTFSLKHCANISLAKTGIKFSDGHKAKLKIARAGRIISEETCAKMSVSMTGEKNPFYGKQHSEEARAKMRASRLAWLEKNKK